MIKLKFTELPEKDRSIIVDDFYELVVAKRTHYRLSILDNWCQSYLDKSYTFKTVVCADPALLEAMKKKIDLQAKRIGYDQLNAPLTHITNKGKKRCYVKDTLFEDMPSVAKNHLIDSLKVRVCPYCNRNYIFSGKDVRTCELDHFFPKSLYPIFAVSFYNLIPSCPTCNGKKKDDILKVYPHRQQRSTDELIRFEIEPITVDHAKVSVEALWDEYEEQIKTLHLRDLYAHHDDLVTEILLKKQIFNDDYLNALVAEFADLGLGIDDLKEMLYGVPLQDKKYGQRPLAKFIHDIIQ